MQAAHHGRDCGRALPPTFIAQVTWLGAGAKRAKSARPALEGHKKPSFVDDGRRFNETRQIGVAILAKM